MKVFRQLGMQERPQLTPDPTPLLRWQANSIKKQGPSGPFTSKTHSRIQWESKSLHRIQPCEILTAFIFED